MKKYIIAFWEFVLLIASVLIFRSIWIFLDLIIGTNILGLWLSLIVGAGIALISLVSLNRTVKKEEVSK